MINLAPKIVFFSSMLCIGLQFSGKLSFSLMALLFWMSTLLIYYRQYLRQLWRPRFFIFSLTVSLLSSIFLGPTDFTWGWLRFSSTGISAGLLMFVRSLLFLSITLWLTKELLIAHFAKSSQKSKFSNFHQAAVKAIELIPLLVDKYTKQAKQFPLEKRNFLVRTEAMLVELISSVDQIADQPLNPKDTALKVPHETSCY